MKRIYFYLAAIALHVVVLFGIKAPASQSLPAKEKDKYMEVTLEAVPPPPKPFVETKSDVPNPVAGPVDKPESEAAPGPPMDDLPPPVAKIVPEVTPPPPSPVPPVPNAPPSSAPPTLPLLSADGLSLPVGPPTPNTNPPPTTGNGKSPSGAPVSGTGKGGGGIGGSVRKGGNGHYYEAIYTPDGITWAEAQSSALAHGGYLATISSAAENNFVFSLINDPKYWKRTTEGSAFYYHGPWIGGFKTPDGQWQWVNNEGPIKYTRWEIGEPDNRGGNQDRLCYYLENHSNRTPTWDDTVDSNNHFGFVVEWDSEPAEQSYNPNASVSPMDTYTPPPKPPPPMTRH